MSADPTTDPHAGSHKPSQRSSNGVGAADPFDLDALRNVATEDFSAERVTLVIPVRRPKKDFIRVCPDEVFQVDAFLLEHEEGFDRVPYWVSPTMVEHLAEGDRKRTRLLLSVTKMGALFFWPIKLPEAGSAGGGRRWAETALQAAELGKEKWIRVAADKNAGGYEVFIASGNFPEPKWPDEPLKVLLEKAFKDRFIDSPDHSVLRELRGEI